MTMPMKHTVETTMTTTDAGCSMLLDISVPGKRRARVRFDATSPAVLGALVAAFASGEVTVSLDRAQVSPPEAVPLEDLLATMQQQ